MKKGWELKRIGQVCLVIAGQSPEGKFYNKNSTGLPFYQGKKEFTDKFIGKPTTWTTKVTKEAIKDDILMSVRAPVGPVNFSTEKICIGRGLAAIRSNGQLDKEFLFNFFVKYENEITGNTGAVFNSINKSQIEAIEIPIPPLPEQKRIVKILDKAFKAIDKAKENAEKNFANAKELFESYLNGIFSNPGKDWEEKRLGDVCDFVRGPFGGSLKKSIFKPSGYAVYEQQHAIYNQFNSIRYFIDENKYEEMKRFDLKPGDLIMSCSGTMGKVAIVPNNHKKGIINQALLKISTHEDLCNEFLKLWMSSVGFQKSLSKRTKGAAIKNVASVKVLKEIDIPIPSLPEQKRIVSKFNAISTETKRLETIYQQKATDFEGLKKSLLRKAFDGEL